MDFVNPMELLGLDNPDISDIDINAIKKAQEILFKFPDNKKYSCQANYTDEYKQQKAWYVIVAERSVYQPFQLTVHG